MMKAQILFVMKNLRLELSKTDYVIYRKRFPRAVVIAYARKMNTLAAAKRLMAVDSGHYIVSKP